MKIKLIGSMNVAIAVAIAITIALASSFSTYAVSSTKTVTSSTVTQLILGKNETADSNWITFTVSGLPATAEVTKIEVTLSGLTSNGAILSNYVEIESSNLATSEQISWSGAPSTVVSNTFFDGTTANGIYKVRFNGTCLSGYILGSQMTYPATKSYSSSSIKIYYQY